MTIEELLKTHDALEIHCSETLRKANTEYATTEDSLDNFKLVSRLLEGRVTPIQVAAVYMTKHFIGIMKMVNGNFKQRDSVLGRFIDLRNYATLLYALIEEGENERR